jgi:Fe-S cluster biogenesis protein NfuA
MENNETKVLVEEVLDKVRPYLQRDGGDIELLGIQDGVVYVRLLGACIGCSSLDVTLKDGVEALILEYVPGIIEVVNVA